MELPYQGKAPGVTALIRFGAQCGTGDAQSWTMARCMDLFDSNIDTVCADSGDGTHYQIGHAKAKCDGTFISVNFGG